jgi:hypothetical protein
MVTSRPFRTPPDLYQSTVQWAEETESVKLERGQFIPWEEFRNFDMSLGQSEDEIREHYQKSEDIRLTYHGLTVQAGASHWQFLAYKKVIQQFLPFDMERPMGQVRQLDQRVNEAGYLRLMPVEFLAQNMSNRLDWIHSPEEAKNSPRSNKRGLGKKILNRPFVKRFLLGAHDRIFRWYYDD